MKPETALISQAAMVGALFAVALGVFVGMAGHHDVARLSSLLVLPSVLATCAAVLLALRGWRRAGGMASGWPATRIATSIVLHLLWILPALIGMVAFILQSTGWVDLGADVGGIGIEAVIGITLMIAAVGSAVVWGLPAYALAVMGCRHFLARQGAHWSKGHDDV